MGSVPVQGTTVWINWIAVVLASAILVGSLALGACSNLLRHPGSPAGGAFSLARTQLLWWTDIIAVCVLLHQARTGTPPRINATCIAVLGIGLATAIVATLIDMRQHALHSHLGREPRRISQGFFRDILSGAAGLGVHRLQLLIFEVIYGVGFVGLYVHSEYRLPTFGLPTLLLLGVSSGGYLVLKAFERGPRACDGVCTRQR